MTANRLGSWSAFTLFVIGAAYIVTLAAWFSAHGVAEPIADPTLAIMEILTLLSAPLMVVTTVAVHVCASPVRKVFSLTALAFMILVAGMTSAVHFVELTVARQLGSRGIVWPSVSYAVELLAWNPLLGLSLLFAAPVFEGSGLAARVRRGLYLSGALCMAGTIGPVSGHMRLQLIGVLGYAGIFPIVCLVMATLFRNESGLTQKLSHANPPVT